VDQALALQLLRRRFGGRNDVYLLEVPGEARWRYEAVTDELLLRHLRGEIRIGLAVDPASAPFVLADFDGKNRDGGLQAALHEALRFLAVVEADAGVAALLELSRSRAGVHVWLIFDPDSAPSLEESRRFVKAALRCAGLANDGDEAKGHPGIFPHPPGKKKIGRTPFLPWSGLLAGHAGGVFVDANGAILPDQTSALAEIVPIAREALLRAIDTLAEQPVSGSPPNAAPTSAGMVVRTSSTVCALDDPIAVGHHRHDELRGYTLRLRSLLPQQETLALARALAHRWGMLPGREAEVDSLVHGAYRRPARDVATEFDRESGLVLPTAPAPVDLYSPEIVPVQPEFTVGNFIRRSGLHLVWAQPSAGKTWTLLWAIHELMVACRRTRLLGHPELAVRRGYRRVLWVATEESASTLRYKADQVRRGLGTLDEPADLDGQLLYLFAADLRRRINIYDLPYLIEQYGPLDAIVLDSLTGLRPKTVAGQKVNWDLDNDASNELCLFLRGLATEHATDIILVHHSGRDTSRYRGATDWWASADVMVGLVPDSGRTKIVVEKNRDGKRVPPFLLEPSWGGGAYRLDYVGSAGPDIKVTPTARKIEAWMQGRGQASQAEIVEARLAARSTTIEGIQRLLTAGSMQDTGNRVNGSPIYRWSDGLCESSGRVSGCPELESDTDE